MYTQCLNSMISDFYQRSNQVKASFRMCECFTLAICILLLYNFNNAPLKMNILHGVNVCELYFVCLIPLITILFLI